MGILDGNEDGSSASNYARINTANLTAIKTLLTDLQTAVDGFSTTISTFRSDYVSLSSNYENAYYKHHTNTIYRDKDESDSSYYNRINNTNSMAKNWITQKKNEALGIIDALAGNETLSSIQSKVEIALSVFTNIEEAKTTFDDADFEINYESYFKSAVKDAENNGWLVKNYTTPDADGGKVEDGHLMFEMPDGSFSDGETERRAGFTQMGIGAGGAVVAAATADAQGWTQEQRTAAEDAAGRKGKSVADQARTEGKYEAGNNRDDALALYRDVTGEDYDPEKQAERTRQDWLDRGIDPDALAFVLCGDTNPAAVGPAGTVLTVAAAAVPSAVTAAQADMSPDQVADWKRRLSVSPITGETNEDIAKDLGLGDNDGLHRTTQGEGTPTASRSVSADLTGVDDRLIQEISDTISIGSTYPKYPTADQGRAIDDQAKEQYYDRSAEDIEAERARLLQETEDAYNGINVDSFKDTLRKGGYSEADIQTIMEHKEVGFTAYVMASQATVLTDISKGLASNQGILAFDSSYDNGLNAISLFNGQAQANLGAELDPDVTDARSAVARARASYHQKADDANESIEEANASRDELEAVKKKIVKKSGKDCSKWSDEEVDEYNEAVKKYNEAQKKASKAVDEANKSKEEFEASEEEYKKVYDEKYKEYLKEAQEGIKAAERVEGTPMEGTPEVTTGGKPAPTFDGSDDAILDSVVSHDGKLDVGEGGKVEGITQTTPTTDSPSSFEPVLGNPVKDNLPESFDGSDQAILSGLNLGNGDLSIGTPDAGVRFDSAPTMNIEAPSYNQSIPNVSGNIRINPNAFSTGDDDILNALSMGEHGFEAIDDRVIPGLGLDVNMSVITGGSVNGITTPPQGNIASDASIINGLNITNEGISTGSSSYTPIETPSVNSMVSPEFDRAMSGGLTSDDVDVVVSEDSNKKKETSKFVEPPSEEDADKSVEGVTKEHVENGIVIEIGEDGSLRL